jgi:hypothetical protein
MFRHDHVPDHHEPGAPPDFLQDTQEQIAAPHRCQQRPPAITTGGDEVQVLASVVAAQTLGHTLQFRSGRCACPCRGKPGERYAFILGLTEHAVEIRFSHPSKRRVGHPHSGRCGKGGPPAELLSLIIPARLALTSDGI